MPGKPANTLFEWKWKTAMFKSTFQISPTYSIWLNLRYLQ
jgi:hypothetical protein